MKLIGTFRYASPVSLFFLLCAAPALAQFEVSPDHPDDQQSPTTKMPSHARKTDPKQQGSSAAAAASKSPASSNKKTASGKHRRGPAHTTASSAPATQKSTTGAKLQTQRSPASMSPTQHLNAQVSPVPRE